MTVNIRCSPGQGMWVQKKKKRYKNKRWQWEVCRYRPHRRTNLILLSTEELVLSNVQSWRRLLRVPWTARRLKQSILKEMNPEYSLEGLMLKLKLQYFGYVMGRATHWKRPSCWKRLKAGGKRDDRGWDGWVASPTQWTWIWTNSRRWWRTGKAGVLQSMGSQRVGHDWVTELNIYHCNHF